MQRPAALPGRRVQYLRWSVTDAELGLLWRSDDHDLSAR